jgi:lipopolysaccharide export system permease protein
MKRVRILDRYIFLELVTPFVLSMAVLTLVLFIQKIFRIAELVVSKGATLMATIKLFLYIMPNFLVITIPVSVLVASLTAFTRLSADSEITALKSSRISLYRMLRPVAFFAFLAFLAAAFTSLVVLPGANHALKEHLFNMVKSRAMVGVDPGVFTSTFDGMVIYVDKMKSLDTMQGIFISDERSSQEPFVITAKRGKLIVDQQSFNVTLAMEEGSIHTIPRDEQSYTLSSFVAGRLYLDINQALLPNASQGREFKEMSTPELLRTLRHLRSTGAPTLNAESEVHTRFAMPFACLIIGLIGAPLGIRRSRTGKSAGIAIALMVFFVYYIILGTGKNLAEAGKLSAMAAYWMPNAFMAVAGASLIFLKGQEISLGFMDRIRAAIRNAWQH